MHSLNLYDNRVIDKPLISFVIPTYKRNSFLEKAIDSIIAQKPCITFDILVISNNPDDNMQELIDKYRDFNIAFFKNVENYGQVGNINQGILLSKGEYVSFLHDDDFLLPNYLSEISKSILNNKANWSCIIPSQLNLYDYYKSNARINFFKVLCFYRLFYRKRTKKIKPYHCLYSFRDIYNPPTCGTIFRKKDLLDFGLFKDVHGAAWDYYNFRLFNSSFKICLIHSYLGVRRMYTGMSNKESIKLEFKLDELEMINDNKKNLFLKLFGKHMVERKGFLNVFGRLIKSIYFYLANLDGYKNVSKKQFQEFI